MSAGKAVRLRRHKSKNGTGRERLNASFRVTFNNEAPIIVTAKSFASRPHLRVANQMMIAAVAIVRKIVEPTNEMPRIAVVIAGDAS